MNKFNICILFLLFSAACFSQNKLEQSKNELKAAPASDRSTGTSRSNNSGTSAVDEDAASIFMEVIGYTVGAVFKYGIVGDYNNEDHLYSSLSPYPFYNLKSGNYERTAVDSIGPPYGRIDIEDHFIYSYNKLYGNHLKVKGRPCQYLYFQGEWHQLFESNKVENTSDGLSLFHLNLCYDRIRFEKFNLGWSLGASYVGSGVNKAGFSYGVSAEYFMLQRISFAGSANWSRINGQPVNVFGLSGRFYKRRHFLSLGYERLKIATPNYNFISIGAGIYF